MAETLDEIRDRLAIKEGNAPQEYSFKRGFDSCRAIIENGEKLKAREREKVLVETLKEVEKHKETTGPYGPLGVFRTEKSRIAKEATRALAEYRRKQGDGNEN